MKAYTKENTSKQPTNCGCYLVIGLVLLVGGAFWIASEMHALRNCTVISHNTEIEPK